MASLFDLDGAILAMLQADPTLVGIATDGIWFDSAAGGAQRYVLVSRVSGTPEYEFQDLAWITMTYQVKACLLGTSAIDLKTAADRIDALMLDLGGLSATGWQIIDQLLEQPIRYGEPDPVNPYVHWQHGGGHYAVRVIPTA